MPVWGPRARADAQSSPPLRAAARNRELHSPGRAPPSSPPGAERRPRRHEAARVSSRSPERHRLLRVLSAVISEPSGPGLPAEPPACPFCESGSFGVTDGREEPAQWPRQPPSSLASTAPEGFHGLPPRARGKGWVLYLAHRKVHSHFENELR